MDIDSELLTTVVGSYPSRPERSELINSFYEKKGPFESSLKRAVEDQLECGLDLISDGQTRASMVDIFAKGLSGYRIKERVEIVERVKYSGEITVEDQRLVREIIPDRTGLKGIVTGPCTLVESSKDMFYEDKKEAVMDTAEALAEEAIRLSSVCDVIQIDEPLFSIDFPDHAQESLEKLLNIDVPIALHVCGDVTEMMEELVELDVDILDHEFTTNPVLYDKFSDIDFPQRLSVGVVSTEPTVEEVEEIRKRIEKAVDLFGPKVMIDPDCGLRNLDVKTAKMKLKNMVEAKERVQCG